MLGPCNLEFGGEWGGGDESLRHRAESQWIVTARPLCHLHYPVAYLSRLQRILPTAQRVLHCKEIPHSASTVVAFTNDTSPWRVRAQPYCGSANGQRGQAPLPSLDSDLEAFSHNPAHGSFAPLAFQPSAMTICLNQWFLSY
ncbi:hypothetical protein AMTR_s00191p00039450 [Amborella trichopoda]|uniref:Uncharacterized protein n=1 Tax=Amborella trichopoda TaxID=13333 RepID=W1PVN2_AMBTC|nr:hypothetical protein AMTR_s00191p00039450 [Amborella trichopoda]